MANYLASIFGTEQDKVDITNTLVDANKINPDGF